MPKGKARKSNNNKGPPAKKAKTEKKGDPKNNSEVKENNKLPPICKQLVQHFAGLEHKGLQLFSACNNGDIAFVAKKLDEKGVQIANENELLHLTAFKGDVKMMKMLIEKGGDLCRKGYDDMTPLIVAVLMRRLEVITMIVDMMGDKKLLSKALEHAINCGYTELTRKLIGFGAEISCHLMHCAVERGDLEMLQLLGENLDFELKIDLLQLAAHYGHFHLVEFLHEHLDINARGLYTKAPLHEAAGKCHAKFVEALIKCNANVNVLTNNGKSPLHFATKFEIGVLLIQAGADPNIQDKNGQTPLYKAAEKGRLDIVKLLVEAGADLSVTTNNHYTPHLIAAINGHTQIVKYLVIHQGDKQLQALKDACDRGKVATIKALLEANLVAPQVLNEAVKSGNLDTVKLLVSGSVNQLPDRQGKSPLIIAVNRGHNQIVQYLIKMGASANEPMDFTSGTTVLHHYAAEHNLTMVKFLLDQKANVNAKDSQGLSPLHLCIQNNSPALLSVSISLLQNCAQVDECDRKGCTPLIFAAMAGNVQLVKLLLHKGANVSHTSGFLFPLLGAASNGNVKVMDILLKSGANVNQTDWEGKSALLGAVSSGEIESVRYLLQEGAFIGANYKRVSPLSVAVKNSNQEMIQLLITAGANVAEICDDEGMTIFASAVIANKLDLVDFMLKVQQPNSAMLEGKDYLGRTPFFLAVQKGLKEMSQKLLEAGANINSVTYIGEIAVGVAANRFHIDILDYLIRKGAKLPSYIVTDHECDCSICMESCVAPLELKCGHHFCWKCIVGLQKRYQLICPNCRGDFDHMEFYASDVLYIKKQRA